MLNEHHSTPFCMGSVINVEAAILARITDHVKICLLGNILPIWEDPLWLAETLAQIDMISEGRLVTGWVRGTGRESLAHNSQSPYNWERYQEAHDFIVKAWTDPGPFRWEGAHYDYRYVNPWSKPLQNPHPPIWIPGAVSQRTVAWAAEHHYPYIMLATRLEPTRDSFAYYDKVAREFGYEAGPQHRGYLWKVHVDETEELAEEVGRKYLTGPGNIFLEGSRGDVKRHIQNLPGMIDRRRLLPTAGVRHVEESRGTVNPADYKPLTLDAATGFEPVDDTYRGLEESYSIISGTPKTVLPKIRHVLEYLRPGSITFWGRRRLNGPRRHHALAAPDGRRGPPRNPRDGRRARPHRPLRPRAGGGAGGHLAGGAGEGVGGEPDSDSADTLRVVSGGEMPQAEGGLRRQPRVGEGPPLSLRDISPRLTRGERGSFPHSLQLLNHIPHLLYAPHMAAHAPRISLRLWINMLRRAGWSARSAEEVAEQLDAELQRGASGEASKTSNSASSATSTPAPC